jgi:drug/metabolite transporter (DMT)-like permease
MPDTPSWKRPANLGPILMILASLAFTLMVACVKVARAEMSALEIATWRGLSSIPLAWLLARGASRHVQAKGWLGLRVVFGFGAMTCFFTSAKGLPIADLSLIGRLQPLLIALAAPLILGVAERSDRRIWGLMLVGVAGCSVILGPGLAVGNVYGLWALAAIALSTVAHITLRALGATDDPRIVVMVFQIGVTILALLSTSLITGSLPSPPRQGLWLPLLGVGVLATFGQLLMTQGYALATAARVSAASHTSPVWGIGVDIVLFSLWPSPSMILGGTVVMLAVFGLLQLEKSTLPEECHEDPSPPPPRLDHDEPGLPGL